MKSLLFLILAVFFLAAASVVDPRWGAPAYVTPGGTFNITLDAPASLTSVVLAAPGRPLVPLQVVAAAGDVYVVKVPADAPLGLYDLVINSGEIYEPKAVWVGNVTGPLRVFQMTDEHIGVELDMASVYRLIHAVLLANSGPYDVVFITGDQADVGGQVWHHTLFVRYASSITKPIFVIPGNHDHAGDDALVNYRRFVGPPVWYRVVGPYLIIGLDSGYNGYLTDDQVKFYEEALKKFPDKVKVVLIHHPPFYLKDAYVVETYRGPQDVDRLNKDPTGRRSYYLVYTSYLQNRPAFEKFLNLTIRYKVSLVLSGHVHSGNSTVVLNGTYFVTTRTLGGSIDTSHGFRTFTIYPDGTVEVGREVWTYKNFAVLTWGTKAAQLFIDSDLVKGLLVLDLPGNFTGVKALQGSAQLVKTEQHPLGRYTRYYLDVSGKPVWLAVGDYAPAPSIVVERVMPRSPTPGDLVTLSVRADDPNVGVPFLLINGTRILASYLEEKPVYIYKFKYSAPVALEIAPPGGQPVKVQIGQPPATTTPKATSTTPPPTTTQPATPTTTAAQTTQTTPAATPPPVTTTPTRPPVTTTQPPTTPSATIATAAAGGGFPAEVLVLVLIVAVGAVAIAAVSRRR